MRLLALLAASALLFSCATVPVAQVETSPTEPTIQEALTYEGPKARVAVGPIKCKAAKCSGRIGEGLRDMLISALFTSGRFVVLGSKEELQEIRQELELAESGYVRPEGAPQVGTWEAADVVIVGSITAFEPQAGGLGGLGGALLPGFLGGIRFEKDDAYIAMDLKLVDVRTRRIIKTARVQGKASSFRVGGLGVGFGSVLLGAGLEVYQNTPMERAVRVMLDEAVRYISTQMPQEYFRYGEDRGEAPELQRPQQEAALHRPAASFSPGPVLLWAEDFSGCAVAPRAEVRILQGVPECVQLGGKKWLAGLKGRLRFERHIPRWKPTGDWALELSFYLSDKEGGSSSGSALEVALGNPSSPYRLRIYSDTIAWHLSWAGRELPQPPALQGQEHHLAIQKQGQVVRIFLDGRLWATVQAEPLSLGRLKKRLVITTGTPEADIQRGSYSLVTGLRLSAY